MRISVLLAVQLFFFLFDSFSRQPPHLEGSSSWTQLQTRLEEKSSKKDIITRFLTQKVKKADNEFKLVCLLLIRLKTFLRVSSRNKISEANLNFEHFS